jgi:hypothetical protein
MRLLIEAVIVGIVVTLIGTLSGYIVGKFNNIDLPSVCKKWNKNHIMEISLFITGFFTHLLFELLGLNGWYCKGGHACSR